MQNTFRHCDVQTTGLACRLVATWGRPLLCISLLSVAACSNSDSKATAPTNVPPPVASTTTTAPRPPTTTTTPKPAPPYSFDNSVPPPKLINTGKDYKKIIQSLLDYSNWIAGHHPDRAAVREIAAPGSRAEATGFEQVGIYTRTKRRFYETYVG